MAMQYDGNSGTYYDDGAQDQAPSFAVQPTSAAAPPSDLAVKGADSGLPPAPAVGAAPGVASDIWTRYASSDPELQREALKNVNAHDPRFPTVEDFYKYHYEHFGAKEGRTPLDTSSMSPAAQQYVREMTDYMASQSNATTNADPLAAFNPFSTGVTSADIERMASTKVPVDARFATTYTAYTNGGDARYVTAVPGQEVRLVDSKTGNVVFSGTGPEAAQQAAQQASSLSQQGGTKAAWTIETHDPETGDWKEQANDKHDYSSPVMKIIADIGLPTLMMLMALPTGGLSLAGGLSGLGLGSLVGAGGLGALGAAGAGAAGSALGSTLSSVLQGRSVSDTAKRALISAATAYVGGSLGGVGKAGTVPGAGTNVSLLPTNVALPAGITAPAGALLPVSGYTGSALANTAASSAANAVPGAVSGVTITVPRLVGAAASNLPRTLLPVAGYTGAALANSGSPSTPGGLDDPLVVTAPRPVDPVSGPLLPPAVLGGAAAIAPGSVPGANGNGLSQAERDAIAGKGKLTPLQIADLAARGIGLAGTLGGLLGGGGGGSGGGASGTAATLAQLRAGLSPTFSAKLGAPRGMFSALGSAGTPYTPRPISNLQVGAAPSGASTGASTGASSGASTPSTSSFAVPSTAALDDYLARYPDVAAEAARSASHYGDLNQDGIIDRRDFALGHYLEYGPNSSHAEPRTMAAKTGGYIEKHAGDGSMPVYPRFQALGMASGGSVDPRALAESYRSKMPADMSVFQNSPYSSSEPGTMGGMYHYGEAPWGEQQFFNYAMAPGATAPWLADTPTGTGVYNMFGVRQGGAGDGAGTMGGGTGTTGTGPTGGGTTVPPKKPAVDPNVWWNVPDHPTWQQYDPVTHQLESSAAAPWGADVAMDPQWGALQNMTTNQQLAAEVGYRGEFGSGGFQNWIVQQPESVKSEARQILLANDEAGRIAFRRGGAAQFAVHGAGTGRTDDIPARLSDGEYVIDAETVALLGDGSSKAGAQKLDQFRVNIRKQKGRDLARGHFSADAREPGTYLAGGRV